MSTSGSGSGRKCFHYGGDYLKKCKSLKGFSKVSTLLFAEVQVCFDVFLANNAKNELASSMTS